MTNHRPQNANLNPIKPGEVRNPNGRPKGSRNKLGEAFLEAMHADFEEHGVAAIIKVRTDRPHEYLKVIAGMLPKELKITAESDLTDDQILDRLRQLDAVIRPLLGLDGEAGTSERVKTPLISH